MFSAPETTILHCRYPWGKEALEVARRENKMIFLSIGYSTCHWLVDPFSLLLSSCVVGVMSWKENLLKARRWQKS